MSQTFTILSKEYIPQKELHTILKDIASMIPSVNIQEERINSDGFLVFTIQRVEKSLPKVYGEYEIAVIKFMLETEEGFHKSEESINQFMVSMSEELRQAYRDLIIINTDHASLLWYDFLNIFMEKYPDLILESGIEDDSGELGYYTYEHLKAGRKLDESAWFWENPDELLRRSNAII